MTYGSRILLVFNAPNETTVRDRLARDLRAEVLRIDGVEPWQLMIDSALVAGGS